MAGLSTFQSGPKGTKMVNLNVFYHLGPILGPSGPFWTISDKNDFFAPNRQNRVLQRCFGAKYQFLFKMIQKGRRAGPSDNFQIDTVQFSFSICHYSVANVWLTGVKAGGLDQVPAAAALTKGFLNNTPPRKCQDCQVPSLQ